MLTTSKELNTSSLDPAGSFMKLPIGRYLELMSIEPNSVQKAIVNALNSSSLRFIVACVSRRVGKTFISNIVGNLVTLMPGKNVLIVAPNYSLAAISWDLQKSLLKRFDIETERLNAKDRIIELANGSTIRIGSVSKIDSVVGRSYDLIIFDEAALDNKGGDAFNIQLRPTLDKPDSKAIFISTPRGKNWFFDFFNLGSVLDDWVAIHADWEENPRAFPEDIAAAARTMSAAKHRQEYYADWIAKQGKIYELPSACINNIELGSFDTVIGLDLGFKDPTAAVVARTDGRVWYVVDEYQDNGLTTSQYAAAIHELVARWEVDFIYIDSANQQMKYDFATEYDLFTVNADKDILLGIGYCQGLIENENVYVDPSCGLTLGMLGNLVWDDREGLLNERVLRDQWIHLGDAFRYMMYSHRHNFVQTLEYLDNYWDDEDY